MEGPARGRAVPDHPGPRERRADRRDRRRRSTSTATRCREGQIVTFLDVYGTCGRCWYCTVAHATTRCPQRKVYGVTLSSDDGLLGGWAEYIHLRPGVHVIPLPEALDWRAFMAGGCGMPTALHAVTLAEIAFGDTVVVQGAGPVGLCAAALAQLRGAGQVIVDRRAGDPARRRPHGSAPTPRSTSRIPRPRSAWQRVRELTQRPRRRRHDRGHRRPGAVPEGMRLTRDAGRYVVVGQYTDVGSATFNPHLDLNQKHLDDPRLLGQRRRPRLPRGQGDGPSPRSRGRT